MNVAKYLNSRSRFEQRKFIRTIYNWVNWDAWTQQNFNKFLNTLPKTLIENYSRETMMYRGMTVSKEKVNNNELTSWTTNYDTAVKFSEIEANIDMVLQEHDKAFAVVYQRYGKGLDFSKLMEDTVKWMEGNIDVVEEEFKDKLKIIMDKMRTEEEEFLAEFNVEDVNLCHVKEVSLEV